ncbi:MAG: DUF4386 domain-containing protein [Candidatus Thorarchaeota archaeon]
MTSERNIPKLLGAAYLVQFVASLLSDPLSSAALGSGSMSEKLVNISNNVMLMRVSILADWITSLGIIVMTVLLYIVLQNQNKVLSLVALSFWLIEAVLLIISSIGAHTLIPLSLEYVQVGAPDPSYFLTLGSLFFEFKEFAYTIHMLFFGLGGILWYYLFYRSEKIPRGLSIWGLVLISLMPIDVLLVLLGVGLESILRLIILFPLIAYLPFEGVMGIWFIVKGIRDIEPS